MRRLAALLSAAVAVLVAGPTLAGPTLAGPTLAGYTTATAGRTGEPGPFHDVAGLHALSVRHLNSRLLAIVATTAALPRPVHIYVLLPPGYGSHPNRRYPVLYLLHGTSGSASDWVVHGDAQRIIGDRPMVTVMPDIALDDDGGGWCTDWPDGAEQWETFHIHQLVPWVDANLRTLATRAERAIAGLSQGGFCAMSYAARHPDLFATALAYSGAPDVYYDLRDRVGAIAVINATEVGLDHVAPDTFFGNPVTDAANWAGHDPASLAGNLRWTRLFLYWGNGEPGPYDTPATYGGGLVERAVWYSNTDFRSRLAALHIPAVVDAYGPGTHSWPYWARDLAWSINAVMSGFDHPEPPPVRFSYTSTDDAYAVYGWGVRLHRRVRGFSTLAANGRSGFVLSGRGWGLVATPPVYRAGRRYVVWLHGAATGTRRLTVRAARDGRLYLDVPLGPGGTTVTIG